CGSAKTRNRNSKLEKRKLVGSSRRNRLRCSLSSGFRISLLSFSRWDLHGVQLFWMDAARRGLGLHAEEMVERAGAFAGGVGALHGFLDVDFGEQDRVVEIFSLRELGGDGRGERATGAVRIFPADALAFELRQIRAVEEHVHGLFHVAALYQRGAGPALH